MKNRSEEVSEITECDRHAHFGIGHRGQIGTQTGAGIGGKLPR
jgi:hypothetical protein